MGTIVQKYGGSSVSTPEKLKSVAQRVVETHSQGHKVVVVVSAMGDTTNQLLSLAKEVSPQPQRRELDMLLTVGERISMSLLSMAIQDLGVPAVSFTGSQSGIITTDTHTNARIIKVKPSRIRSALEKDLVVIVAGFQGVSERLEITSLGRGGSDTTAVALAAALNADFVEICSDVDGVYSADPRVAQGAVRVSELSYDEMQTLADSGAKVLNAEAVEWAKRTGIEVRCVATNDASRSGTSITSADHVHSLKGRERSHEEVHTHPQLSAVTHHPGLCKVEGQGKVPFSLVNQLRELGCVDAEVLEMINPDNGQPFWQAWLPLLNLHLTTRLQELFEGVGAERVEDGWSWVTLVGRSLLSFTTPKREADVEQDVGLLQLADQIFKEQQIEAQLIGVTPYSMRWAIRLEEAPALVRLLHERLLET